MPLFQIRITLLLLLLPILAFGQAFEDDYFQPHEFGLQNNIELVGNPKTNSTLGSFGKEHMKKGLSYSFSVGYQYLFRKGLGIHSFISYGDRHFIHEIKINNSNQTGDNPTVTTNFQVVELGTGIVFSPFKSKRLFFYFGGGLTNFFNADFERNYQKDELHPFFYFSPETIRAFEEYSPVLFTGLKYSFIDNEDIRLFFASDFKFDFKSHTVGSPYLFQTYIYSFSVGFNVKIKPDKRSLFLNL